MRLIDVDALYDAFERTPWMDNADRDIAEEVMDNAPTVNPPLTDEQREQLADTDACDRLRWILNRAERVVRVDDADRAAVDRACRLIAGIDNGFDRVRR